MTEETKNVFKLVTAKEENKLGYIRITYANDKSRVIQADSFGPPQEMAGYMAFFSDDNDRVIFINNDHIKEIEILDEHNS